MKILYVGYHNPHFMSLTEYVERAITHLGHDIETFDYRDWMVPGRIRKKISCLNKWDQKRINKKLIRKADKVKPDLILVSGGWTVLPETIAKIKKLMNPITAIWIADFPLKFNEYLKAGPHYDYFFASGTDALARYHRAGHNNGHWLPFACDPEIHKPVELSHDEIQKYGCDISFVGGNYTERAAILERLTDFTIGIWGMGWDRLPKNSALRKSIRGNIVTPAEWVKIFSASKIVLNIIGHRCDVMEPFVDEKEFRMTNTKVFEILGCGAFQLCDQKADANHLFEDKRHLSFYQNADELIELIRYYLKHPEMRNQIAQNGYLLAVEKHTYDHRVKELLSVVSRIN